MDDLAKMIDGRDRYRLRQGAVSVVAHVLLLVVALGVFHRAPAIAPSKLPGDVHGTQLLTYYAAGSPAHATSELASKAADKPKLEVSARAAKAKAAPEKLAAPSADRGAGSSAESGVGDGEINMAQLTFFPHPKPDLSSLPHGM